MALELKSTVTILDGCYGMKFVDSTGDYTITNPGGYGSPNIETKDVTSSTIKVYPPESTIPYIFSFTIDGGEFITATLTSPDGTVTDIYSDIQYNEFPFTEGLEVENQFYINGTYFGYESETSIIDGSWTIEYSVTSGVSTYIASSYVLSACNTSCCVQKMFINLNDCGCDDSSFKTAELADAYLKSAIYSADMGYMEKAQKNIVKASEICKGNCKTC